MINVIFFYKNRPKRGVPIGRKGGKMLEKEDIEKGLNIEELKGNIIFSDVSFAYDKTVILNNISFEIKSGEKTALVGKTRKWKVNYY